MRDKNVVVSITIVTVACIIAYIVGLAMNLKPEAFLLFLIPLFYNQFTVARKADATATKVNVMDDKLDLLCANTSCPVREKVTI